MGSRRKTDRLALVALGLLGLCWCACKDAGAGAAGPGGEGGAPTPVAVEPVDEGRIPEGEALAATLLAAFREGGMAAVDSYLMTDAELAAIGEARTTRARYLEKTEAMFRRAMALRLERLALRRKELRPSPDVRLGYLEGEIGTFEIGLFRLSGRWKIFPV